jgi:hypothetical protein
MENIQFKIPAIHDEIRFYDVKNAGLLAVQIGEVCNNYFPNMEISGGLYAKLLDPDKGNAELKFNSMKFSDLVKIKNSEKRLVEFGPKKFETSSHPTNNDDNSTELDSFSHYIDFSQKNPIPAKIIVAEYQYLRLFGKDPHFASVSIEPNTHDDEKLLPIVMDDLYQMGIENNLKPKQVKKK